MNKQNQKQRLPHGGSGRHLLRVLTALIITLTCIIPKAYSQKVYATFDETNGILNLGYGKDLPDGAVEIDADKTDGNWIASEVTEAKNVTKIIINKSFADYKPTSCHYWFSGCTQCLEIEGLENIHTDDVKYMHDMFQYCNKLTSLDVSSFNTENVITMDHMFDCCIGLISLDLSNFHTEKVTSMSSMFIDCTNLTKLSISNFNTENVELMDYMFYGCSKLTTIDITNFNTEKVVDMERMFCGCEKLSYIDVSNFNTQNVESMCEMFVDCISLKSLTLDNFNTEKVRDMEVMFGGCTNLTYLYVNNFNTENVESMMRMFVGCTNLTTLDISSFNTQKVVDMSGMFHGCTSLKSIIVGDKWTTASVTSSDYMFTNCNSLSGSNGSSPSVLKVYDATYARADGGKSSEGYFTYSSVTHNFAYAVFSEGTLTFYYDNNKSESAYGLSRTQYNDEWGSIASEITKVVFDQSFQYFQPRYCAYWFYNCSNLTEIIGMKEYLNTSDVDNMSYMFYDCGSLTSLDVTNFDTENNTHMEYMFAGCSKLTTLDVSSFKTDKVKSMEDMFAVCSGLSTIDITNFNTKNVKNMDAMFAGCSELQSIYVGDGWETEEVSSSDKMFLSCSKLIGGEGTSYNSEHTDATYACIDGGDDAPGYFTKSGQTPFPQPAVPYALFDNSTNTLTICYNNNLPKDAVQIDAAKTDGNWIACEVTSYENVKKIIIDESFAEFEPSTCKNWFYGLTNLTEINGIENINTANVTDMSNMFEKCSSLISLDLSSFDTKNVQNMEWMFSGCSSLTNLDLSNFNTANNTSTSGMFADCSSLTSLDLSNFSTKNVTSMKFMFYNCESLTSLDLSSFNTDKVENMRGMFQSCKNLSQLLDLSNFNTENVTDISYMFNSCFNLKILDLSNFNTKKVTTMESVFYFNYNLKEVYVSDKWSTSSVQKSNYMFSTCNKLKGGKGTVFDENYTDGSYARIDGGESAPGYFTSSEDKPSATTYAIFDANTNTLTIGYGKYLPDGAVKIDAAKTDGNWIASEILENFPTTGAIENIIIDESFAQFEPSSCKNWFSGLSYLTEIKGIENINTANVTDMSGMFQYCRGITNLDLSSFNTENVTNMRYMFNYCSNIKTLDLSGFNTAKVTDMSGMFYRCDKLVNLDVSSFNTENVTNMQYMFAGCSSINELDLSSFNTESVTDMSSMFDGSNFETIYVSDQWSTKSLTKDIYMFASNYRLVGGMGTLIIDTGEEGFSSKYAHIDGGEDNPGYFTKYGDTKPKLLGIEIGKIIQTEFILGEPFSGYGTEVFLLVENREPQKTCNLTEEKFFSGYDETKLGKQTITVEYYGLTTTYEVTVTDKDAPYAIFNEDDHTMTFYYGKYKEGATLIAGSRYPAHNPNAENAEKVIFDKSFADYKPISCDYWFSDYTFITEIVDMEKYLNTEDVEDMQGMFNFCRNLTTLDLSNFKTDKVKRMNYMFYGCRYLSGKWLDLSHFNTENVVDMSYMFNGCCFNLETLDLSSFNTENVTNMEGMFGECYTLQSIYVSNKWTTSSVKQSNGMFSTCNNLKGGKETVFDSEHTDLSYARIDGGESAPGYFTKSGEEPYAPGEPYAVFDGVNTLTLYYGENKPDGDNVFPVVPQFSYINPHQEKAGSITTVVFDQSFKNYHPTSTAWWFWYDTQLTEIKGLEYLKTDKVTDMSNMFTGCEKLETLDLSGFNTANVKQMEGTFRGCTRLTTILIGDGWNVDKVEDSGNTPFEGCYNLFGSQGTVYSDDATSIKYAHIDGGENDPGYLTKKGTQKAVPLSIKITKYPLQDYSIGQNLSYDGSIAVTFDNGRIVDNIKQFSIIGYDAMQVGKQKLQIEYLGLNTPLEVIVSDKPNGYIILDKSTGIATCYYGKYKDDAYYYTSFPYGDERDAVTKIIFDESFKEFHSEYDCFGNGNFTNLTEIVGIEYLNTDNIKDMTNMFLNCSKLEKVDLSHFITNQATRMDGMFANCTSLTSIDLSTFNTKNVTSMIGFVSGCSNLQTIYVGDNWKSASGIDFFDCNNLVGGKGTHYVAEHTDATYARIDGGASAPGYFTAIVPVSIAIADKPKTEYLEGDVFSTDNGTLTVTYNSGRQETIDLSYATISGFDNTKIGEQTITVTYLEKTTSFKVNVAAKSAIAIEITQLPTKLEYIEGEEFVPDGGEFVVTYNNKTSETLELAKATISGFDNTKTGEQTLTVSYLGQKAEIKVTVSPKPEENPYTKPETESDVYMISNLDELLWFVHAVNHGDVKAKAALTRGIVINQNCLKQIAQLFRKKSDDNSNTETATDNLIEWIPIGTPENPFQGTFDGQGHTISGIYFNDASQSNVGLFGNVGNEAVIKNLGVTDTYISGNENVGAICGKSEGTIVNCYTVSVVKGNKNTNSIAGENTDNAVVKNSFYLAETPIENDPCAKTAKEFKSGDVAKLLAQGATVNGVEYNGNSFSGVVELPGTEDIVVPDNPDNPHTPVSDISDSPIVKVWSFNHTIFIENAPADTKYTIIDLNGRVITTSTTKSSKEEIRTDKTGILLVIIDNQSFKIIN